jgi:hypothetical protein
MKVELDLSENQSAAVAAVASHFNASVADTILALMVSRLNIDEEQPDLEASIAEAREAIRDGRWQTTETQPFGWLEIPAPTVAVDLGEGESIELDPETAALLKAAAKRHGVTPDKLMVEALGYLFADGPDAALATLKAGGAS